MRIDKRRVDIIDDHLDCLRDYPGLCKNLETRAPASAM